MLYQHEFGPPTCVSPRGRDELLLQSASGDRAAFADFYDELVPIVVAVVHHRVENLENVYPIVLEIFIMLWKEAGQFDPRRTSATLWVVSKALRNLKPTAEVRSRQMQSHAKHEAFQIDTNQRGLWRATYQLPEATGTASSGEGLGIGHIRSPFLPEGASAAHVSVDLADQISKLTTSLASRTSISTAVGILMERYGLEDGQAFAFLVRQSQTRNVKLREIAAEVVHTANASPGTHCEYAYPDLAGIGSTRRAATQPRAQQGAAFGSINESDTEHHT